MDSLKHITAKQLRELLPDEVLDELANEHLRKQSENYFSLLDFSICNNDHPKYYAERLCHESGLCSKMNEIINPDTYSEDNFCHACTHSCTEEGCKKPVFLNRYHFVSYCEDHFLKWHQRHEEWLIRLVKERSKGNFGIHHKCPPSPDRNIILYEPQIDPFPSLCPFCMKSRITRQRRILSKILRAWKDIYPDKHYFALCGVKK